MQDDDLILAIDQGTHSTRALVFDAQGRQRVMAQQAVDLQVLDSVRIEQSPQQILSSMQQVVAEVLQNPTIDSSRVRYAGLATQRSSVLAWTRDKGTALSPVLSWQDRRAATALPLLQQHGESIRRATGLRLSPHYGASKLQWLLTRLPGVAAAQAQQNLVIGPLASYLLQHLLASAPVVVDDANASRTLLWNLLARDWDDSLLQLFGIPRRMLPECRPILYDYGVTASGGIPLRAVNGDQTAALYAQGMPVEKTVTVNIGTGAFVLLPTENPGICPEGLLAGISCSNLQACDYYVEGTVNGAAAALEWAAQRYHLQDWPRQLPDWLAQVAAPPIFLNSIGGLGAPWWHTGPVPHFLTEPESPAAAMAGVAESILFLVQTNIDLLRTMQPRVKAIRIGGGLARQDGLCQKLADLSGLVVQRQEQTEATARGIAWLAAGGPAEWSREDEGQTFIPVKDAPLQARYLRFCGALAAVLQEDS
ncbi:MAG: FGGY family carbohydrate kinase [Gammaproteobacteria bacterium]|jgi:glycerol kinase